MYRKRKWESGSTDRLLIKKGNCIAGCELLKYISEALHLHIFDTREWKVEESKKTILQNSLSMWFCSVAFLLSAYFSEDGRQFPFLTITFNTSFRNIIILTKYRCLSLHRMYVGTPIAQIWQNPE